MNIYISLLIGTIGNALRARQDVELENLAPNGLSHSARPIVLHRSRVG